MTVQKFNFKDAKEVIKWAREQEVEMVNLKFTDLIGTWQHSGFPTSELTESAFEEGVGFDGSSIRGWKSIESSDMLLKPDPATARIDPFFKKKTLSLICNVADPVTGQWYDRDPRGVGLRAEDYLRSTGIADTCYCGPEAEFFIFDDVRYDQSANAGYYQVDSVEGIWNSGRNEQPNLGYKVRFKEGYFPVPPTDKLADLRHEICLELEAVGITVEREHHEVATAGQGEIDMRFDSLVQMADKLMWFKHIVKNVAARNGKAATFMPKPIFRDNGSGMHTHMSLWKEGKPLFYGEKYAGLSELALHFIGGILAHGKAIVALTNPTTNSYRRLVPGYEAPISLAYSSRNRSAAIRIPMYSSSPKAKRIEFRTPDASSNGYLTFAAMLMAGLDGVENRIDPGQPMDKDIYSLSAEERKGIPAVPGGLDEALRNLDADHAFLLRGGVFTEDFIQTWIEHKYSKEVQESRLRPTPFEFMMYFDT